MKAPRPYFGISRYLYANWPVYALLYAVVLASLLGLGFSLEMRRPGLALLATAIFVGSLYNTAASLLVAHQLYDAGQLEPHHRLFDMSYLQPEQSFAYISLGSRERALALGRRLTTGTAVIVDVYNPQQTPQRALVRRRRKRLPIPTKDPRFTWLDGSIDLLPLPDESINVVFLCQTLSQFWQEGDRRTLLAEIFRILPQNGRLLVAEQIRSQASWLAFGPAAWRLQKSTYWRQLLEEAGFMVRKETDLQGLMVCLRAEKPTFAEARQLALGLELGMP